MADMRAQKEEFANAYIACLATHGVTGSVTLDGHVLIDSPVGPDGQAPAGLQEANIAAGEACNDEVPWFPEPDAAEDYARMLDVRSCLIDQGFTIPEPPSRDVWIESTTSMTSMPWTPYAALLDIESDYYVDLSDEELTKVFDACQQNYFGQYTVAVP